MTRPDISIVMPSFEQKRFLETAVRSVLEQGGVNVELLVLDPGSTDGSRELLLNLQEEFGPRLVLFFEPDQGQSDAINKGMAKARGPILGWLNSDDRLRPGSLRRVVQEFSGSGATWLYGQTINIDHLGNPRDQLLTSYKNWRGRKFSFTRLLTENFIPQMSVFWTRELWDKIGGLNLSKHLDMDYDLWLRFASCQDPVVLSQPLADFRVHPGAKGSQQTGQQLQNAYLTARQHAAGLGLRGAFCLLLHRAYGLRTRLAYLIFKP